MFFLFSWPFCKWEKKGGEKPRPLINFDKMPDNQVIYFVWPKYSIIAACLLHKINNYASVRMRKRGIR